MSKYISLLLAAGLPSLCVGDEVEPVTDRAWQEVAVSVHDLDRSARFFTEIGDYETKWRGPLSRDAIAAWGLPATASGDALLIGPAGYTDGLIRLVRFDNAGRKQPIRPGARTWDTGCYFSLMVRMKDMDAIYDDAVRLGWWTETPITFLEFGESRLNVVIYRGPDGLQVQGYERLSPALPGDIPNFSRMTGPFNVMQMVRDRDIAYAFFTDVLGFDTFYFGKPFTAPTPTPTPLGIPTNLTTSVAYGAGIVYPRRGEFGRMEMIEIMGLDGNDYANRCHAPNLGILSVRFPVEDVIAAAATLDARGWATSRVHELDVDPYGRWRMFDVRTPDGAVIQFFDNVLESE